MSKALDKSTSFRLPEDELLLIKNYADYHNISYSEFLRESALSRIIPEMRHFFDVEVPEVMDKLNGEDDYTENEALKFFSSLFSDHLM